MNLKEKVLNMTPSQLVMAMVNGLKNEHCSIDMDTFGRVRDGICFGCASTNALQEIAGMKFTPDNIENRENRAEFLNVYYHVYYQKFLYYLEMAFNYLRQGDIKDVNYWLNRMNYPHKFPQPSNPLPVLTTENYKEELQAYIDYANEIK